MKTKNGRLSILLYPALILGFALLVIHFVLGKPTSYIWVMDWDSPANMGHVAKMCSDGHKLFQVELGVTGRIAVDPRDGTVLVPRYYDEQGALLQQAYRIGTDGTPLRHYPKFPSNIQAIDPNDGSVWSAELGALLKFDSNGGLLERHEGFEIPVLVALSPLDHTIWVADDSNTDRGKLRHLDANLVDMFSIDTHGIVSLAMDPAKGRVWYVDLHGDVYSLSAEGNPLVKPTKVEGLDDAVFVSLSRNDGTVWVAEDAGDKGSRLVKLSSDADILQDVILAAPPSFAAVNPYDHSVWVGTPSTMMHVSADGRILGQTGGFQGPAYVSFAPAIPDLVSELKCAFHL